MRIIRAENYEEMSRRAADVIAAQVLLKPDSVLGLATGSTPEGAYRELVRQYERGELDFSEVTTVNLDEYCGLGPSDPQSYAYFMRRHLFDHVNVRPERTHLPDGTEPDAEKAAAGYDEVLRRAGRTDLQLLGIGPDGHIGFNEPAGFFTAGTHRTALDESTIRANARFFDSSAQVPRYAYTMGMAGIMTSRRVLLIASGRAKAEILAEAVHGPVTPHVPASILQLHPDCILIADREAMAMLDAMSSDF